MLVAFRVDASIQIGTGHVMRCVTLADHLVREGHECFFIMRDHNGNLNDFIKSKGYKSHLLPTNIAGLNTSIDDSCLAHSSWLGCSWRDDAQQSSLIMEEMRPDWLVVDHYALDVHWEEVVRPKGCRLMVIDDIADRSHCCELLLDQNLGRSESDYTDLVPLHCICLIGPRFALLRPEFAELREFSMARRAPPKLRNVLVSMGGIDKDDMSGQVLDGLIKCNLPKNCRISVVMGENAPWRARVRDQAADMPWITEVLVNVTNMAKIMADTDLAIGAAGSTSWERCCLGLTTLAFSLADNQLSISQGLHDAKAVIYICHTQTPNWKNNFQDIVDTIVDDPGKLASYSRNAAKLTNGIGSTLVVEKMAFGESFGN